MIHATKMPAAGTSKGTWTFITNHAAALLVIDGDPEILIADLASEIDVSERAAQRIVRDLQHAGYLEIEKLGRRNRYRIAADRSMRHSTVREVHIQRMLELLHPHPRSLAADDPLRARPSG